MSKPNLDHPNQVTTSPQPFEPQPTAPLKGRQKVWMVLKVINARLRFIAILVITGLVIGYWDTVKNSWDRGTRPNGPIRQFARSVVGSRADRWLGTADESRAAADSGIEYYCPMHPNVVRDHPDKCPICGMPLSQRKRGETPPLPEGVTARVFLSPYRIALAGIRTSEVGYRPLTKEIVTVGNVDFDERRVRTISARVKGRVDKLYVDYTWATVQKDEPLAELYSPELYSTARELRLAAQGGPATAKLAESARERMRLWGIDEEQIEEIVRAGPGTHLTIRSPLSGHVTKKYVVEGKYVNEGDPLYDVADLSTIWVEAQVYEDDLQFVHEGQAVEASTSALPGRRFKGKVAFVHPHLDVSTRTNVIRFEIANPRHELRPGMFMTVEVHVPMSELATFRHHTDPDAEPGTVLSVPESAVIDTGQRKVVYVERSPGQFEGVEVELGPPSGSQYPVIKGLAAGDRVATAGSFLVDAETRLNPAAGAGYFGASGGPQGGTMVAANSSPSSAAHDSPGREPDRSTTASAQANADIAKLIAVQKKCPVTGAKLGSMGKPFPVVVNGRTVLLCCAGCKDKLIRNPDEYLRKLVQAEKGVDRK